MKAKPPRVETVALSKVRPWGNPRQGHAVDAIARSIEAFGYLAPIIVQAKTYRVLAGHGRLQALKRSGASEALVVVADLTDAQATAYTLADNRLGESSEWNPAAVAELLKEMEGTGVDLEDAGFSAKDIKAFGSLVPAEDREETEPVPAREKRAVTKFGDVWECGDHLAVCGDSTAEVSWSHVPAKRKAQVVFTDPPYGVDYVSATGKYSKIKNDAVGGDKLGDFLRRVFERLEAFARNDAAFYVWHASSTREDFAFAMKAAGLIEVQYLLWVKPSFTLGRSDYQWAHEPCFYAAKAGQRPLFVGDRKQQTVWRVAAAVDRGSAVSIGPGVIISDGRLGELAVGPVNVEKASKVRRVRLAAGASAYLAGRSSVADVWEVSRDHAAEHPTQKPVALPSIAISNSSRSGDLVADAFLGSGATMIACERLSRACYGVELDPCYIDVAVRRWQNFSGKKARNLTRANAKI